MFVIRKFEDPDADQIVTLFYDTVHSVNARDYTLEQLNAWAPKRSADERKEQVERLKLSLRKHISYVADMGGQVVGFADIIEDGYLNRMFAHKDHQGEGIGSALLRKLECEVMQLGITEVRTDASITAKPFFERHGCDGSTTNSNSTLRFDGQFQDGENFIAVSFITLKLTTATLVRKCYPKFPKWYFKSFFHLLGKMIPKSTFATSTL
ncbi:GNAT family N-acetyltransferase [Thermoflavimicrobium dichotomicum]|uniref:L-amino acid N-acyltransferase YncA n=1 Tax=Thermoflavimicrobium dichotomicum TaxID=46223 RepID=A0A1I3S6A8_9BACL|nr:GNAT family N-acetyltransferase [Thermoflavimicrobium dichotomicum]SFJ54344.1 L-amino acid N-acyltransferase YncA [Thermoflavimicrobium dichotomicum]